MPAKSIAVNSTSIKPKINSTNVDSINTREKDSDHVASATKIIPIRRLKMATKCAAVEALKQHILSVTMLCGGRGTVYLNVGNVL